MPKAGRGIDWRWGYAAQSLWSASEDGAFRLPLLVFTCTCPDAETMPVCHSGFTFRLARRSYALGWSLEWLWQRTETLGALCGRRPEVWCCCCASATRCMVCWSDRRPRAASRKLTARALATHKKILKIFKYSKNQPDTENDSSSRAPRGNVLKRMQC